VEVAAFAPQLQHDTTGLRFGFGKINPAELERVLANRDGTFVAHGSAAATTFSRFEPGRILVRCSNFLDIC
jgi:hypothetical protein